MALTTKLTIVNTSKDGKTITVKDSTGIYDATTNPGGYLGPNPGIGQIESIDFFVESFGSRTYSHKFSVTGSTSPNTIQVIGSEEVKLIPSLFGETSSSARFEDGVLQVSMRTTLNEQAVTASVGTKTVSQNGTAFYTGLAGFIFDGVMYFIDQTKANSSSVVYLIDALPATYTVGKPFYLTTSFAFSNAGGKCCIATQTGRLVEDNCSTEQEELLIKLLGYTLAAETAFSLKNYSKADSLAERVKEICNSLNCGC